MYGKLRQNGLSWVAWVRWFVMRGMGRWFVIDGLAEMVCDGGMIAMISHGRDGSAGLLS